MNEYFWYKLFLHVNHYRYPSPEKHKEQQDLWSGNVQIMRPDFVPTKHSRLCSIHFEDGMFETTCSEGRAKLKSNAIPTKFFLLTEGLVRFLFNSLKYKTGFLSEGWGGICTLLKICPPPPKLSLWSVCLLVIFSETNTEYLNYGQIKYSLYI